MIALINRLNKQSVFLGNQASQKGDMSFKVWMKKVDAIVGSIAGLSVHDLADIDFFSRWEDEVPPREVALEVLENEGFPF